MSPDKVERVEFIRELRNKMVVLADLISEPRDMKGPLAFERYAFDIMNAQNQILRDTVVGVCALYTADFTDEEMDEFRREVVK